MAKARATCDAVLEGNPAAVSAVASVGLAEDVLRKDTARKNAVLGLEVAGSTIPELLNSLNAVLAEVRRLPELIRSRRDVLVVPLAPGSVVNLIEAAGDLLDAVNTAHDAFSSFQETLATVFKTMEVMVDYATNQRARYQAGRRGESEPR